jgi:hypothetical protein
MVSVRQLTVVACTAGATVSRWGDTGTGGERWAGDQWSAPAGTRAASAGPQCHGHSIRGLFPSAADDRRE